MTIDCLDKCCGPGSWAAPTKTTNHPAPQKFALPAPLTAITCPAGTWSSAFTAGHRGAIAGGSNTDTQCSSNTNGGVTFTQTCSTNPGLAGNAGANSTHGYSTTYTISWSGTGPACGRAVNLAASGGGSINLNVQASLHSGTTASAAGSGSGSATSLGNATATLTMVPMSIQAIFTAASANQAAKVQVDGNFGASKTATGVGTNVSGTYSSEKSMAFTNSGTGTISGTASYSVSGAVHNDDCTNQSYTRTMSGNATCGGSSAATNPGVSGWNSSSQINIAV